VVNGTPIGMLPDRGMPVPEALFALRSVGGGCDLYTALDSASDRGQDKRRRNHDGRDLAVHQAPDSFELFTGFAPPIVEMGNAFDAVMAKRYSATSKA
jgi:shikimate dehydrogenase